LTSLTNRPKAHFNDFVDLSLFIISRRVGKWKLLHGFLTLFGPRLLMSRFEPS
jgi:hypothetical protein